MTDEIKVPDASVGDKLKAGVATVLILGGIVGFYVFATQPAWERWLMVLAGLLLGAALLGWSAYGRGFWQFVMDSRVELRKIVWPNRQETGMTTLVVFVFVITAGLFFWLVDLGLAWATRFLSGQG